LINFKKVAIPSGVPDSSHVFVGIDIADGYLYLKDDAGVVSKYLTSSSLATVATTGDHVDLLNKGTNTHAQIDTHIANTSNPHAVTKTQVGLSNVDNTSDLNKPISTATQTALNLKINSSLIGANSGVASLDSGGKVPSAQLPSFVDDVLEFASLASFPGTGETGKIYVALDTNKTYRWSGSAYVEISASPGSTDAVTEGVTNLYFTTARVLATALSGLSTATNAVITTADTVLSAFGKLQKQISDNLTTLTAHIGAGGTSHANATTSVAGYMSASDKTKLDAIGGARVIKSGELSNISFAGNPKKVTVTFANAMANTSYTVLITGQDSRVFTYESKATTGFVINANANAALTGAVSWMAISGGETVE
jgi:hypothetical protein